METKDRGKTLEGLKLAIQMEIDGKEYYLEASKKSNNEVGKKLLETLASEEDLHRIKFKEIYEAIIKKKDWPTSSFQGRDGRILKTILTTAKNELMAKSENADTEFSAVQIAMDMENTTYDFYINRSNNAASEAEKSLYNMIAAEERGHYLTLLEYHEYITDPASWFTKAEHTSLDGG
jgi:rubrerythrin